MMTSASAYRALPVHTPVNDHNLISRSQQRETESCISLSVVLQFLDQTLYSWNVHLLVHACNAIFGCDKNLNLGSNIDLSVAVKARAFKQKYCMTSTSIEFISLIPVECLG